MALAFPRPLLSVDVIIFSILSNELVLLLTRRPAEPFLGQPCLPGGFIDIDRDEDLEACARRKLPRPLPSRRMTRGGAKPGTAPSAASKAWWKSAASTAPMRS